MSPSEREIEGLINIKHDKGLQRQPPQFLMLTQIQFLKLSQSEKFPELMKHFDVITYLGAPDA